VYLAQGLAVILAFIGVKLVFHALHVNEVSFINGGQPLLWVPEIPIWFSLLFIAATILVATAASLAKTRRGGIADGGGGALGDGVAHHRTSAAAGPCQDADAGARQDTDSTARSRR
jgi:tellurite resistance protein TerC